MSSNANHQIGQVWKNWKHRPRPQVENRKVRQRQHRQNIRNYCYPMSVTELETELRISKNNKDTNRERYVRECLYESLAELAKS